MVCSFGMAAGKLVSRNLRSQKHNMSPRNCRKRDILQTQDWNRLTFHLIFLRHNHERELRVPHNNALQPNPASASTAHNFNLRAMEIRADQLAAVRQRGHNIRPAVVEIQHLLHVLNPHLMQTLEDLKLALFLWKVVDSRDALFPRGERLRFLVAEKVFLLAETVETSSFAVVSGGWRGRAQEERLLLYSFGEQLVCGVRRVGAREELVRDMLMVLTRHDPFF